MALPLIQSADRSLQILQTQWKSQIDPVLADPIVGGSLLKNVKLNSGTTVINHLLGQIPQGWIIVDINGGANIYRSAPFNNLTLTLTSSAAVTVTILVF